MIRFRKYNDINLFSYFSITNYVALLCCIVSLFVPTLYNHNAKIYYSLIDILGLGFSSVNIIVVFMLFACLILFILNMFFQPSWTVYFINFVLVVYLFVSPVLMNFQLLPLLNLHRTSLTLYVGSILIMISAILFTIIEIYKVSIMDVFVNRSIKEKKQRELNKFINSRRFKLIRQKDKKSTNDDTLITVKKTKKHYHIKKSRLKTHKKYKKANLPKIADYSKHLDTIYKI